MPEPFSNIDNDQLDSSDEAVLDVFAQEIQSIYEFDREHPHPVDKEKELLKKRLIAALNEAIGSLPSPKKEIVQWRMWPDPDLGRPLTYEEIGKLLGTTGPNVRMRLKDALLKLKLKLMAKGYRRNLSEFSS